jgi:hypothetical protein
MICSDLEGKDLDLIEVLSPIYPEIIRQSKKKKFRQDSECPSRDSNSAPLEYKSTATITVPQYRPTYDGSM